MQSYAVLIVGVHGIYKKYSIFVVADWKVRGSLTKMTFITVEEGVQRVNC